MRLSELAAQIGARRETSDADTEIVGAAGLDQAAPGQETSSPIRVTPGVHTSGVIRTGYASNQCELAERSRCLVPTS